MKEDRHTAPVGNTVVQLYSELGWWEVASLDLATVVELVLRRMMSDLPLLTSAAFSRFWYFRPRNLNLDCGWSTVPVVEHHASTLQVSSLRLNGLVVWFLLWVLNIMLDINAGGLQFKPGFRPFGNPLKLFCWWSLGFLSDCWRTDLESSFRHAYTCAFHSTAAVERQGGRKLVRWQLSSVLNTSLLSLITTIHSPFCISIRRSTHPTVHRQLPPHRDGGLMSSPPNISPARPRRYLPS